MHACRIDFIADRTLRTKKRIFCFTFSVLTLLEAQSTRKAVRKPEIQEENKKMAFIQLSLWALATSYTAAVQTSTPTCAPPPPATDICFCPTILKEGDGFKSGLYFTTIEGGTLEPTLSLVIPLETWFIYSDPESPTFSFPDYCGEPEPRVTQPVDIQNDACKRRFKVEINYVHKCNFTVVTSEDKVSFSGKVQVDAYIERDWLSKKYRTTYKRKLPFTVILPRILEVETKIKVYPKDQCNKTSDCNGQVCLDPPEEARRCECDDCHEGQFCGTDNCPPRIKCPSKTIINACSRDANGKLRNSMGGLINIPQHEIYATDNYVGINPPGHYVVGQVLALSLNPNYFGLTLSSTGPSDTGSIPWNKKFVSGAYFSIPCTFNNGVCSHSLSYTVSEVTAGKSATCEVPVEIHDVCPPTITCPKDMNTTSADEVLDYVQDYFNKGLTVSDGLAASLEVTYQFGYKSQSTGQFAEIGLPLPSQYSPLPDGEYVGRYCVSDKSDYSDDTGSCCEVKFRLDSKKPQCTPPPLLALVVPFNSNTASGTISAPTVSDVRPPQENGDIPDFSSGVEKVEYFIQGTYYQALLAATTGYVCTTPQQCQSMTWGGLHHDHWTLTCPYDKTVVCFKVTDKMGHSNNPEDCCADIHVDDDTDPKVTCNPNLVGLIIPSNAPNVQYIGNFYTASDNDMIVAATSTPPFLSRFLGVGSDTLPYYVEDRCGNAVQGGCPYTVIDNQCPKVMSPPDPHGQTQVLLMSAGSNCASAAQLNSYLASFIVSDNSGSFTVTWIYKGNQYNNIAAVVAAVQSQGDLCGENTFTITMKRCDPSNNCCSSTITFKIKDDQKPSLVCPYSSSGYSLYECVRIHRLAILCMNCPYSSSGYSLMINTDQPQGSCGTPGTFALPVVTDNYGVNWQSVTFSPPATTCFEKDKATPVEVTVCDIANAQNCATCPFTVVVKDPTIVVTVPDLEECADTNMKTKTFPPTVQASCKDYYVPGNGNCNFDCSLSPSSTFSVLYIEDLPKTYHTYDCCYTSPASVTKCATGKVKVKTCQAPQFNVKNISVVVCDQCNYTYNWTDWTQVVSNVFDNDGQTTAYPISVKITPNQGVIDLTGSTYPFTKVFQVEVCERLQYVNVTRKCTTKSFTLTITEVCGPLLVCPREDVVFELKCPPGGCKTEEECNETTYYLTEADKIKVTYMDVINAGSCGEKPPPQPRNSNNTNITKIIKDCNPDNCRILTSQKGCGQCVGRHHNPSTGKDEITIDFSGCKPQEAISWACCRGTNAGPNGYDSKNGIQNPTCALVNCDAKNRVTKQNKCEEIYGTMVYEVSPSATSIELQMHVPPWGYPTDQPWLTGNSARGFTGRQTCGGNKGPHSPECDSICQFWLDLDTCGAPSATTAPREGTPPPDFLPYPAMIGVNELEIGEHTVVLTLIDAQNQATVLCPVVVKDKIPPCVKDCSNKDKTFEAPGDIPKKPFMYNPQPDIDATTWYDNVEVDYVKYSWQKLTLYWPGAPMIAWTSAAGSIPVFAYDGIIFCTKAVDVNGNEATDDCCWQVNAYDKTPPNVTCPEREKLEANNTGAGAKGVVNYKLIWTAFDAYPAPDSGLYWCLHKKCYNDWDWSQIGYGHLDATGQKILDLALFPFSDLVLCGDCDFLLSVHDAENTNEATCKWNVSVCDETPPKLDCRNVVDLEFTPPPGSTTIMVPEYTAAFNNSIIKTDEHDRDVKIISITPPPNTALGEGTWPITVTIEDDKTDPKLTTTGKCGSVKVGTHCPDQPAFSSFVSAVEWQDVLNTGETKIINNDIIIEFITYVNQPFTVYTPTPFDEDWLTPEAGDSLTKLLSFENLDEVGSTVWDGEAAFCKKQNGTAFGTGCLQRWRVKIRLANCSVDSFSLKFPFEVNAERHPNPVCKPASGRYEVAMEVKCAGICDTSLNAVEVKAEMHAWEPSQPLSTFIAYPPVNKFNNDGELTDGVNSYLEDVLNKLPAYLVEYECNEPVTAIVTVPAEYVVIKSILLLEAKRTVCTTSFAAGQPSQCIETTLVSDGDNVPGLPWGIGPVTHDEFGNNFAWFNYKEECQSLLDEYPNDPLFNEDSPQYVKLSAKVRVDYVLSVSDTNNRRVIYLPI
eukprot:g12549.t1